MKPVKNFVFATLLVSALAFNTFAGDVDTPGKASTYDENTPVSNSNTEPAGEAETSDYLFFEALAALLSVY